MVRRRFFLHRGMISQEVENKESSTPLFSESSPTTESQSLQVSHHNVTCELSNCCDCSVESWPQLHECMEITTPLMISVFPLSFLILLSHLIYDCKV